jgi:hypothetical protein
MTTQGHYTLFILLLLTAFLPEDARSQGQAEEIVKKEVNTFSPLLANAPAIRNLDITPRNRILLPPD